MNKKLYPQKFVDKNKKTKKSTKLWIKAKKQNNPQKTVDYFFEFTSKIVKINRIC